MFNPKTIRALNLTPGQAAVLGSFGSIYLKQPKLIQQLLSKHEQNFTGNPNIDLRQLYHLQKSRGDFFTRDLEKTWTDAKYFSLKNLGESLQNLVQTVADKGADVFQNVSPLMGSALSTLAPLAGLAAQAGAESAGIEMPGIGNAASGLVSNLGGMLSTVGQTKGNADPLQGVQQQQIATTQGAGITNQLQSALNAAFAAGQSALLDNRPGAQQVLNELTKDPNEKKILGMKKNTALIVLIGGGVILLAIIIALVIYFRNKGKKKKD